MIKKIIEIQRNLKAPKSQSNKFGKYNYRSCEDILESVKPLLAEHGILQTITDEIVCIEGRHYVKATVTVTDGDSSLQTYAFAREALNKKGMDEGQITGATSSYARKYALNAMWLIDDTKDADTDQHHNQKNNASKPEPKKKPSLNPLSDKWQPAVKALSEGKTDIDTIKKHYHITKGEQEQLELEAKNYGKS